NSLALDYYVTGREAEAVRLLEEAAALASEAFAPDHPFIKNIEANLLLMRIAENPPGPFAASSELQRRGTPAPLTRVTVFGEASSGLAFGVAWSPEGGRVAVAG